MKAALLEEISKLASEGLTADELARAKKKMIGQQQIANQSNDSFGYMAALDELYGLGFAHYKTLEREVEAVTLEDVRRVAAKYFQNQPYVLAIVRPPDKRHGTRKEIDHGRSPNQHAITGEMSQRFIEFVMMQAQNAALFLGQIPNPQTGQGEVNLELAKMFIDQLGMIQEKTRGNLTNEETAVLANTLSNLQMAFVEVSQADAGRED